MVLRGCSTVHRSPVLVVRDAEATVAASGMRLVGVNGSIRMLNDTVRIDSLAGRAGQGRCGSAAASRSATGASRRSTST